ncbi:MAG TPA: SDR family NAD(P)-dependent oxidoreductase [Victivallales bacterium]|nr:SDR family NAD(P)-dependent oxidoreductase [Victivallales bacterium]
MKKTPNPIAIVGIGCRYPGGINSPDTFWEFLCRGGDGITSVPSQRWDLNKFYSKNVNKKGRLCMRKGGFLSDIDQFDPSFFGISPREADYMDPQQRLLLEVTWEALEDAGEVPEQLSGNNIGVFVGIFMHDYENIHAQNSEVRQCGPHTATGISTTLAANRISHIYNFTGPSMVIDTACSSSMVALDLACKSLLSGQSDIALTGGANIIIKPEISMSLSVATMLSPDGYCKSFDASANGYTRAEGVGILVLKTLDQAISDNDNIYSIILATGSNQDGRTATITVPNGKSQKQLITQNFTVANIAAKDVQYVEAHGTGTPVGDPVEVNAIGQVLRPNRTEICRIGSVKSNFGHTESSAGVAGIIKTSLMLKNKKFVPNLHFNKANEAIDFSNLKLSVCTKYEDWETNKRRIASVNSFGFGGSNANALLAEYEAEEKITQKNNKENHYYFPLSAKTPEALVAYAKQALTYIDSGVWNKTDCADIAYSASLRRQHHSYRLLTEFENLLSLKNTFQSYLQDSVLADIEPMKTDRNLVMVFSGMGQQWWAMGRELLTNNAQFIENIKNTDKIFKAIDCKLNVYKALTETEDSSEINDTQVAQISIFSLQVALFDWFIQHGIVPEAVVGHSVGEAAAAYASGALTLENAAKIVYFRSKWQKTTAGKGAMLAVGLNHKDIKKYLTTEDVSIAAVNSPNAVTLAGNSNQLKVISKKLNKKNIFNKFLKVEVPYHSPTMDTILGKFKNSIKNIKSQTTTIPLISSVTGKLIKGTQINSDYWCNNVRQPVQFQKAMQYMLKKNYNIFLEISAHPVLKTSMHEIITSLDKDAAILQTLQRKGDEQALLDRAFEQCFQLGNIINWQRLFTGTENLVNLPHYPWQKESYWDESAVSKAHRIGDKDAHELLGDKQPDAVLPTWEHELDIERITYLADHKVWGNVYFPAAGYIEIFLAAGHQHTGNNITLTDTNIKAPLVLTADSITRLQTMITGSTISIHSKTDNQEQWQLHATANMASVSKSMNVPLKLTQIKENSSKIILHTDIYQRLDKVGLQYGSTFQKLQQLWVKKDSILGLIDNAVNFVDNGYLIHPSILDACFQSCAMSDLDGTYLPIKVKAIALFKPLTAKSLYSKVSVISNSAKYIVVDIILTDDQGHILMEVNNLTCQYQPGSREKTNINDYCYEYFWLEDNLITSEGNSSLLPTPSLIQNELQKNMQQLARTHENRKYYNHVVPDLEKLCIAHIVEAFNRLGFEFVKSVKSIKIEKLFNQLGIIPKYRKLFDCLIETLVQAKIIEQQGDNISVFNIPDKLDSNTIWNKNLAAYPDYLAELSLIQKCGNQLVNILLGKLDAPTLLFAEESALLEHLYASSPSIYMYVDIVSKVVDYITKYSKHKYFRILEIGAGTGGTTTALLDKLPKDRVEYIYTDISQFFLDQAEEKFSGYPFVHYQLFNIEKDLTEQDIDLHAFDIIIATDVLHATASLETGLANIHNLLAPSGLLLLLEVTKAPRWFDIVFGLLDGWWLFNDYHLRTKYPLLDQKQWIQLLQENCFDDVSYLNDNNDQSYHSIILAKNTGSPVLPLSDTLTEITPELTKRPWLLLADEMGEISKKIKSQLSENNIYPIEIFLSDNFKKNDEKSYSINANCPADYFKVIDELKQSPIIINCWTIREVPINLTSDIIEKLTSSACLNFTFLIQALQAKTWSDNLQYYIITNGIYSINNDQINISASPILGAFRVGINEAPNIDFKLIDLSFSPSNCEIRLLVTEIANVAAIDEDEVAIRHSKRFVHRVKQADYNQPLDYAKEGYLLDAMHLYNFAAVSRTSLQAEEVEVEVKASDLNFNDIAKLDKQEYIGQECSGIVTNVGTEVTKFKVGDPVLGLGTNCFAKYLITKQQLLHIKPTNLTFTEAATLPVAFLTAWYCFKYLAQIKDNEKVLIHNASDGLGLACIQVAQLIGAEIFATEDSDDKLQYLKNLGIKNIYSSRNDEFVEQINKRTDNNGVDIVINTLENDLAVKSMSLVKKAGTRFIDLVNFIQNQNLPLKLLGNGVACYQFDLLNLAAVNPDLIELCMHQLHEYFVNGSLHPVAYRLFPVSSISSAFNCLKQAQYIGKLVINHASQDIICQPKQNDFQFNTNGTYLITGGLSGLGLTMAKWLASQVVKQLVLVSRRGMDTPGIKDEISTLEANGTKVLIAAADVCSYEAMSDLLNNIIDNYPPLKGVIHSAMVLDDEYFINITPEQINRVLKPKVLGAWNLHMLTTALPLDIFFSFSSIASMLGTMRQSNYAAGNAFLDALVQYRRNLGLPGLAINWGMVNEIGYVAENQIVEDYLNQLGFTGISWQQMQDVMSYSFSQKVHSVAAANVDWVQLREYATKLAKAKKFSPILDKMPLPSTGHDNDLLPDRYFTDDLSADELGEAMVNIVANITKIAPDKIQLNVPLSNFGIDSLLTMELDMHIKKTFRFELGKIMLVHGGITIDTIVDAIVKNRQVKE